MTVVLQNCYQNRLAQIIQARISEANSLRAEFGPTNVVVIGLKNHADQLINPTDSLFEHQCKSNDPDSVRSDDLTFTAEVSRLIVVLYKCLMEESVMCVFRQLWLTTL